MMLPTPTTSHVPYDKVYEPAEDSFLLLDTLSSETEKTFLKSRLNQQGVNSSSKDCQIPFIVEIGSGSGVVISFINAHCKTILGRADVLTAGIDVNFHACKATGETVRIAEKDQLSTTHGFYLGNMLGDLASFLKPRQVDILIFNPPYVPTHEMPHLPTNHDEVYTGESSHLLSLSYAGGVDGMETINRLLEYLPDILSPKFGCAYVLLCAQNKPEEVKERVRKLGGGMLIETVGTSGSKAGWEKLQLIRIWRV